VARDDLADGGAWLYAQTVREIRSACPRTGIELLIPDFRGIPGLLDEVFSSRPEVLGHNIETVPRVFRSIRRGFTYERSLEVLARARQAGLVAKSNLILGMGETTEEVLSTMRDLFEAGCELLTITQYLRPSPLHHPVDRWVHPNEFVDLAREAQAIGFAGVMSGPLVRSSYRAGNLWARAMAGRGRPIPEHLASLGRGAPARQEAITLLEQH
jgi:lipoic acid synthetase